MRRRRTAAPAGTAPLLRSTPLRLSRPPLFLLLLLASSFVDVGRGQSDLGTVPTNPDDGLGGGDRCDSQAWKEWLESGREGEKTNAEKLFDAEKGCRADLDELRRGWHGPPTHWEKYNKACKDNCANLDNLHMLGREKSKCKCEEIGTCYSSASFWMCKLLWECWDTSEFAADFCDGCGTGQTTAIEFYDELDCGAGSATRPALALTVACVVAVAAWALR